MAKNIGLMGPPTKADAVYMELRDRILRGILAPGTAIGQDALAESLGISTTPLREALRRLEGEHLVIRTAHTEVIIAPLSPDEARELFVVRTELDALAVRLAAESMTDAEVATARRFLAPGANEIASQYLRERWIVHELGLARARAFHYVVYHASHNQVLIEALDSLWARSERYEFLSKEDPRPERDKRMVEHGAILDAISRGDADLAESLMRGHDDVNRVLDQVARKDMASRERAKPRERKRKAAGEPAEARAGSGLKTTA